MMDTGKKLLMLGVVLGFWGCTPQPPKIPEVLQGNCDIDIWIKGGTVIDGSGGAGMSQDVLIRGSDILYIGFVDSQWIDPKQVILATDKVVTPGFIDPHAHGNPLKNPVFENFLAQGVTSIILGQDGSSPRVADLSMWRDSLQKLTPGPNIGLFIGHGTLRHESGIGYEVNPSRDKISGMNELLDKALDWGVWGMSTGLEYTPGMYASAEELGVLAKTVGKYDRMIMSHVRNEDDDQLEESLNELLVQGQHCRVHVSHMKAVYGKGKARAEALLQKLAEARAQGIQVSADVYPYTASYTTIGIVFPEWARPPHEFARVVRSREKELGDYLRMRVNKRNGPEATLLGTAPYAGKSLAEVAQEKGKAFERVLIEDLGPTGASAAYFVMDETLQTRLLQDSLVMVSSDGSPTMQHPRGYGSFPKILETYVQAQNLLSLEEAIWKMTSLPAQTIGITDRGLLKPGKKADVLIFNPSKIEARADFEHPHQLAEGIDVLIINGQVVGTPTEQRYGQFLSAPTRP